ncbi:GntR family transcriptional regulator [Saliterribacillus persicus]|uniref:GntR family transcriptional regulator n=1 Tax=Saliterribacillus persicus TaxID=930114 RepID=A0A368XZA7_9BACI|nr:GntR family transcriptional regulator [Saliterribacillus persicus]RCW71877.1 GntR family transcriptional regulator [Saliterribacillus persicus]
MFELDLRSRKPIYEQLVDKMKQLIINGVLKKDEQLPSVRALAQQLSINPNTIQKAYRELEMLGFIYSLKGKGSFVNQLSTQNNSEELKIIKEKLKKTLTEALFLGISLEEINDLMDEANRGIKRGEDND